MCSPPRSGGRTRVHQPPDLFRGFLHCYYKDIYATRPVARELQHGLVWYYCGLDKPPSRDTVSRFLTDLEHVIDDVGKYSTGNVRAQLRRPAEHSHIVKIYAGLYQLVDDPYDGGEINVPGGVEEQLAADHIDSVTAPIDSEPTESGVAPSETPTRLRTPSLARLLQYHVDTSETRISCSS